MIKLTYKLIAPGKPLGENNGYVYESKEDAEAVVAHPDWLTRSKDVTPEQFRSRWARDPNEVVSGRKAYYLVHLVREPEVNEWGEVGL
jgi:hypothetical protein